MFLRLYLGEGLGENGFYDRLGPVDGGFFFYCFQGTFF